MNTPKPTSPEALRELILKDGRRRLGGKARVALAVAGLGLAGLLAWALVGGNGNDGPRYLTQPVRKGELVINVSANGNLQPTNSVDVGSELSGIIETVFVDVNDRVKKGQVLARLDTSKLRDQVRQAKAEIAAAEARVGQARATVAETAASLARLLRAVADQKAVEASVASARALLSTYEISLAKATIHSPIDGVVLTRKVEPGQTVAAAMTAPVLFTLAEDLRRMELQVDVDEADVGKVKEGQEARFHVDAWPGQNFPAKVTRVGWGSQTKDQVVSYLTILEVRNDELLLRPGMTATADITTARRADVLLVPNMALRFAPPATRGQPKRSLLASLTPRPPSAGPKVASEAAPKDGSQTLWLLEGGQPRALRVTVLGSNGQVSEVRPVEAGSPLAPGAEVIVEAVVSKP